MKTRIIMIRHAEAEGNISRIFHGWTDSEITEKGHKQAMLAAQRLKDEKIDVLYSSSLKRAVQTAEYISREKGLPIFKTDKLKEINGGEWEGLGWHELEEKYPDEYHTWEHRLHDHVMPGGESVVEFRKRLVSEFERIVNEHPGKTICIVTHGTAIKALLCHFYDCGLEEILGMPWVDNTAITIMEHQNGKYKIIIEGDASHLAKELSTIRNQAWYDEYIKKFADKVQKSDGGDNR